MVHNLIPLILALWAGHAEAQSFPGVCAQGGTIVRGPVGWLCSAPYFFDTGHPSVLASISDGTRIPQAINLQLFTNGTNTWTGEGWSLRIDHHSFDAGATYTAGGIDVLMSSLSTNQPVAGVNVQVACGASSSGSGCLPAYFELDDFVDAATAPLSGAVMELNVNTKSDPTNVLGLNMIRNGSNCPSAGCVDGGMGLQIGGDAGLSWALFIKLAQNSVKPLFYFTSQLFAGFNGQWLVYNTPNLEFHRMTGGSFPGNGIPNVTAYTVPLLLANTGGVQVGGSGTTDPAGTTVLNVANGQLGITKITDPAAAVGASGGAIFLRCGTNAGTARLVAVAGTSATPTTILDNIGAGVTGC